jgi:hypothetical protein
MQYASLRSHEVGDLPQIAPMRKLYLAAEGGPLQLAWRLAEIAERQRESGLGDPPPICDDWADPLSS